MAASLEAILRTPLSRWMQEDAPAGDIVLSSRVRLARNLAGVPFPPRLSAEQAERVVHDVEAAFGRVPAAIGSFVFHRLAELDPLDRQVLVEKHLISPQHARQATGAVAVREDEVLSAMVNEEDHLRLQCLLAGLQLGRAWQMADALDDALEQHLDFSFSPDWGYLATCPTNVGTAMRASVMLHLPGLVLANQAAQLLVELSKVGVLARGLYGEGTAAAGNLVQVSNQTSLGQSESEMAATLEGVTRQIVDRERSAREWLYRETRDRIEDRAARAYGILSNARRISSAEALALLSDMRLGIDLHVLPHIDPKLFDELMVETRPGFIRRLAGEAQSGDQRDVRRATLIRQRIAAGTRRSPRTDRPAEEA